MSEFILQEIIKGKWLDFEVPGDEHSRLVRETFYGTFPSSLYAEKFGNELRDKHNSELQKDKGGYYKLLGADKVTLIDKHPFTSKEPEQVPPEYLHFEYNVKNLFPAIV